MQRKGCTLINKTNMEVVKGEERDSGISPELSENEAILFT